MRRTTSREAALLEQEVNVRNKVFHIALSSMVLLALTAVLVPGCVPTGTIKVEATLCGVPWQGPVSYILTRGGETITGGEVPKSFAVAPDAWACPPNYVSGAPQGTFLRTVEPSGSQSVSVDDTITFTLELEMKQDASIEFMTWTINGDPLEPYENGETYYYAEVTWLDIVDVHFLQHVAGCEGYEVTVNETSGLLVHYQDGPPEVNELRLYVANNMCALAKTPEPLDKVSQVLNYVGEHVEPNGEPYPLYLCENTRLDVDTTWKLEKCTNYTKEINWFGVSSQPGQNECVLYDLVFPQPGQYYLKLVASAELELVGDEDINLENNYTESPPLYLTVFCPAQP